MGLNIKFSGDKMIKTKDKKENGETGETALMHVLEGHPDVLKLLVENGADVNVKDKKENGETGETALMHVLEGHPDVLKLLVENGADVNVKDKKHNATDLSNMKRGA